MAVEARRYLSSFLSDDVCLSSSHSSPSCSQARAKTMDTPLLPSKSEADRLLDLPGSMEEKVVKKPSLVSAAIKKTPCRSLTAGVVVASLLAAIFFACTYTCEAAWNIYVVPSRDPWTDVDDTCIGEFHAPSSSLVQWMMRFTPTYELREEDVDAKDALLRGFLWCSAPQAAAALLSFLLAGRRRRCCLALAFVALAAAAANHYMYAMFLGLARVNAPGDLVLAFGTAFVFIAAVQNLVGLLGILVLAVGGTAAG